MKERGKKIVEAKRSESNVEQWKGKKQLQQINKRVEETKRTSENVKLLLKTKKKKKAGINEFSKQVGCPSNWNSFE